MTRNIGLSVAVIVALALVICLLAFTVVPAEGTRPTPNPFCKTAPFWTFCKDGVPAAPPIPDNDVIEVWWLVAPIWEFVLGPIMGDLGLYHSAVGFRHVRTNQTYTIEFESLFESPNATFPYVVPVDPKDPNGQKEIIWCNEGAICFMPYINWTYYTNKSIIAVTNGSVFNKFMKWVPVENETSSLYYYTFSVYEEWRQEPPFIDAYTCDDFAFRALGVLAWLGVDFHGLVLERDFLNFYASKPVPVDSSDPSNLKKIIDFYSTYQLKGKSAVKVAELLLQFLFSDKYIISFGKYYWLDLHWPFFDWRWAQTPIVPVDPTQQMLEWERSQQQQQKKKLEQVKKQPTEQKKEQSPNRLTFIDIVRQD